MAKKSSYQKQKDRIADLEQDIQALTGRLGYEKEVAAVTKYRIKHQAEDAMWAGSTTRKDTTFQGIFPKIKKG